MAELLKLLQTKETFKSELMETFMSQSCREHSKTSGSQTTPSSSSSPGISTPNVPSPSSLDTNLNVANDNETSTTSSFPATTTTTATTTNTANQQPNLGNINDNKSSGDSTTTTSTSRATGDINLNTSEAAPSTSPFYVDPNANCLSDVQTVLSQTKDTPTDKRRILIDQITDVTTESHMATTLNTQENIREANERIARQQATMGSQMPDMSKLSLDPGVMMQHFLNSMVPEITKVVNFSKCLPGFSALDMDDQITLIKQGIFEVMIARITLLIDHATDTMIDPSLKMKSPRSIVRQMSPLGPFIDQFFSIAIQTNPLNLTDGEHGLFGAILVLCPDRCGLKNVKAVQTLQQLYLQALHLLMRHNHKDADGTFCTLISLIPSIRKINDEHFRLVSNIKTKSVTEFETHFPPLHRELFDTTLQ